MLVTDNGKSLFIILTIFFCLVGKDQLFVNDNFRQSD